MCCLPQERIGPVNHETVGRGGGEGGEAMVIKGVEEDIDV